MRKGQQDMRGDITERDEEEDEEELAMVGEKERG